jgi:hypothetical protein
MSAPQLAHRLGRLEREWRETARSLVAILPPDDDLRLSLLRTLEALEQC